MAYKNYVNKFYSEKGVRWDIEIWSLSNSSLSSVEFKTGKGGFKLSYKGSDDRQDITMPSEVTIPFMVSNSSDETFVDSILSSPDGEHFVVIRRNFVIYWWGNLNAGFDAKENQHYPFVTSLKANDFLGEVVNNKENFVIDTQDYAVSKILEYYVEVSKIVSNNWDDDVFPLSDDELSIYTNFRWTAPGQFSYADDKNKLAMFAANPMAFEGGGDSIGLFKKSKAFKEILKSLGLKVFLADGKLYCIQPYNYTENTVLIQKLKAKNPNILIGIANEVVDNRQNAQNDSSVTPTQDSGFINDYWILEPQDYTDSNQNWQSNGSCTSITNNKFNIALTSSFLYIDLAQGQYCLSYSENDSSTYIEKFEGGGAVTLLSESGQINFTVGAGGAELRVRSSATGNVFVEYIGLQKGSFFNRQFLAGQVFRYDRPISKVKATFNSGMASAQALSNFPIFPILGAGSVIPSSQSVYETALTEFGIVSATSTDTLTLYVNLFYGEKFDYLAAINNVTHFGGVITAKLKIGGLYLTGDVNGTLSWSSTNSNFTITMPISEPVNSGSYINSSFGEPNVYIFNANLTSTVPYFTGAGTEAYIGANYPVTLPPLSSGGVCSLQFVSGTINYYQDPDTSNPNSTPTALSVTKNNLQTKFFTGQHWFSNFSMQTRYLSITSSSLNSGNGVVFSSSTSLENYQIVDLGTISLGTTGQSDTNINTIKRLDSSANFTAPTSIQVDNQGFSYGYMTQLLLEQYLEPQINPLEIVEGEYYVNDFSAFKSIVLGGSKYVFYEGSLNAATDIVSGSWYKITTSSETITSVNTGPISLPETGDQNQGKPPIQVDNLPGTIKNLTDSSNFVKNWIKYNSVGVTDAEMTAGTAKTKIQLLSNTRSKLYSTQKLVLLRPDLSHPAILTKDGTDNSGQSSIDIASFTPSVNYPAGSIIAISTFDLTNVIANSPPSSPVTPGGANTNVQYNNNGSFGGDSGMTYNSSTGDLSLSGNILPGITKIKVLHSDFIPNQGGRPVMIDESGTTRWLESFSNLRIYATVSIPRGFKATEVVIYGNDTQSFKVLEGSVDSASTSSKGSGSVGTLLDITDVNSTGINYLLLQVEQSSTSKVYGALVTIAKI